MAIGDIYRPRLQDTSIDVVGGRLNVTSPTSLTWNFYSSNQIRIFNPLTGRWEIVQVTTLPSVLNTSNDMSTVPLVVDRVYDVFAKWNSRTTFDLALAPWSSASHGDYNTGLTTVTSTMASNSTPAPDVTSADGTPTYAAWNAFTKTNSSATDCWGSPNTSGAHWIKYDFGSGRSVCINKYKIQSRNNNDSGANFPSSFVLQGSNDDSNWIDLDTRTGIIHPGTNQWSPGVNTYYVFKNSVSYRYYRLYVSANTSGNLTYIGEVNLVQSSQISSRYEPWATGVSYKIGMRVYAINNSSVLTTYSCIFNHISSTWMTDRDTTDPQLWVATVGTDDLAGLDILDGIPIYANIGDYKSYRWLGVIYTYNNLNTVNFRDTSSYRYISNYYNRIVKNLVSLSDAANYSYVTNSYRDVPLGATGTYGYYVSCDSSALDITGSVSAITTGTSSNSLAICQNSNILSQFYLNFYNASSGISVAGHTSYISFPGLNYISLKEYGNTGAGNTKVTYSPLVATTLRS